MVIIVVVVVVDEVVVVFICGVGLQRRPEDANVYALYIFFFVFFFICFRLLSSLSRGVAAKAIRKTPATCVCVSDQCRGRERDHERYH